MRARRRATARRASKSARACSCRVARDFCASAIKASIAARSSLTECARLRAHSKAGRSHSRHVRPGRPSSVRLTLSPSGRSTSMSKRRPNGDPSSTATRARFTSEGSARTASRPSWPVRAWVASRCRTGQPCSASAFSISRPSCSNAQAKAGEVLCGPGMFRPWLTRVQACRVSSSCWRATRASRATSISSSVTGASPGAAAKTEVLPVR